MSPINTLRFVIGAGLALTVSGQETVESSQPPERGFDTRRVVSSAELTAMILQARGQAIRELRIRDRWIPPESIATNGSASVRFERCAFDGGVRFGGGLYDGEFTFSECTFSVPLDDRKCTDTHIAGARFLKRVSFYLCKFPTALRIVDADFAEGLSAVGCTFEGRVVISGTRFGGPMEFPQGSFAHDASFEEIRATDPVSFFGTTIESTLIIQNGSYSSGVDLSSLAFKTAAARLSLRGASIRGEFLVERSFRPQIAPARCLEIQPDTRLENIVGLTWDDFSHAYAGNTPREFLSVLPVLRQSLLQQGRHDDAAAAFIAAKRYKAETGPWAERVVDTFMRVTSGWGARADALGYGFVGVWVAFTFVYLYFMVRRQGESGYRLALICLQRIISAAVLSFKITFLQGDEQELEAARGGTAMSPAARNSAKRFILVHSLCATVLLLMLGGYIGAQFSGI